MPKLKKHSGAEEKYFENRTEGLRFATMNHVNPSFTARKNRVDPVVDAHHAGLSESLNRKLFDLPVISPAHELPRTGILHSKIVRWLWRFWSIRLSTGGRFFFLATSLFFFFGAASLELQALVPLGYAFTIWVLAFLAAAFEKPSVTLDAPRENRVCAGSALPMEITVTQQGHLGTGGGILIPHRLPMSFGVTPVMGAIIPAMQRGESTKVQFTLTPQRRGVYQLRGYRVETDFPFGLVNSFRVLPSAEALTVYPRFEPLDQLDLPLGRRYQPGGVAFTSPHADSVEYVGNRDYREGDDIRHIDWRATARLGNLIVREYREEYFLRAAVVLDTHVARQTAAALEDLERAISLCAACGDAMNRKDYLVDILAAGPDLYHLLAGRGTASLDQMLDILACIEPSAEPPWEKLEPVIWQNLEQITSVVCIFLDWDSKRREFARRLQESGAAVKVVLVRDVETTGAPLFNPAADWPVEVPILGARQFAVGVRHL